MLIVQIVQLYIFSKQLMIDIAIIHQFLSGVTLGSLFCGHIGQTEDDHPPRLLNTTTFKVKIIIKLDKCNHKPKEHDKR